MSTLRLNDSGIVEVPALTIALTDSQGHETAIPLGIDPISIGSGKNCMLTVDDPHVSGRHCEIQQSERGVHFRDMQSTNGSYIANARIFEAILQVGAKITIGKSTLELRSAGEPALVEISTSTHFGDAIGQSAIMRKLFRMLELIAPRDNTVLLNGETGTGKSFLAQCIHSVGLRQKGPFVPVNCGSLMSSVINDELFGHTRHAFTGVPHARPSVFEQADGGTLFLDEINALPLEHQAILLHAVEEKKIKRVGSNTTTNFDARIIAASNADLASLVKEGRFRSDLYYRLEVFKFTVPPLRARSEDIPYLIDRYLAREMPSVSRNNIAEKDIQFLMSYTWPGNVRELNSKLARFLVFGSEGLLSKSWSREETADPVEPYTKMNIHDARAAFEKRYVETVYKSCGRNVQRAAEHMGVSRQWLYALLERNGIL